MALLCGTDVLNLGGYGTEGDPFSPNMGTISFSQIG